MNFDDRFLGLISMLNGIKENKSNFKNENEKTNQGMGIDGIMNILGIMRGMQGFSSGTASQQTNSSNGLDIMKILPIISAIKGGGFNMGMQNTNQQNEVKNDNFTANTQSVDHNISSTDNLTKQGGFKDKYYAISFAGNEVIYSLGKLWKTYKT